jgi:hypothetical protein
MSVQKANTELVSLLSPWFQQRDEPNFAWRAACSMLQVLPGVRGAWPMSAFDSGGNCIDQSGHGHTLTYNGDPFYSYYNEITPYIDLDGTGDYLSRADEADLDILGTEGYIWTPALGITAGGWVWVDALVSFDAFISKWGGAGARSFLLGQDLAANARMYCHVSGDCTASFVANAPVGSLTTGEWHFCVGRWSPILNEVSIYFDGTWYTAAAGGIGALCNSNSAFCIGAISGGALDMDGRASMCFLSSAYLSDIVIHVLYRQTRRMYGA